MSSCSGVLPMREHPSRVQVSRTRTSTKSPSRHQDLGFIQVARIIIRIVTKIIITHQDCHQDHHHSSGLSPRSSSLIRIVIKIIITHQDCHQDHHQDCHHIKQIIVSADNIESIISEPCSSLTSLRSFPPPPSSSSSSTSPSSSLGP